MASETEKSPGKTEAGVANNNTPASEEATWDGPDDPENPYNWSSSRKVITALVYSSSQLVTTMSASMVAPALDQILRDLHMSASSGQIAFSVYFLGLGFAPFLIAALAETFGRRPVWLGGNVWYILWNSLCPVTFTPGMMIFGRLMAASGASVGVTLTTSVLADMYPPKDRGKSLAIAGLLPYLGPALGPIVGGVAAENLWWPWLFWILSIFDGFLLALGFFLIHESYGPVLLRRKAKKLARHKEEGTRFGLAQSGLLAQDMLRRLRPAISRPVRLLLFRPIIPLVALAMAVQFGVYTLVLSTFATLWTVRYGQSETSASLHYISIALGTFCCAQVGGRLMDIMWRRKVAASPGKEPIPEYRLSYILVGFSPMIGGLLWYAWAAERVTHWLVVDFGVFFYTAGTFVFSQGFLAYLVDEFGSGKAASASAATRLFTYILGFAFPIFAPAMYDNLGYGWGNSLLALLLTVFSIPIIAALWYWGERIRALGKKGTGGES